MQGREKTDTICPVSDAESEICQNRWSYCLFTKKFKGVDEIYRVCGHYFSFFLITSRIIICLVSIIFTIIVMCFQEKEMYRDDRLGKDAPWNIKTRIPCRISVACGTTVVTIINYGKGGEKLLLFECDSCVEYFNTKLVFLYRLSVVIHMNRLYGVLMSLGRGM